MHRLVTRPALLCLLLALASPRLGAQEIAVLGVPHLSGLQPLAGPEQTDRVVERLATFRPTAVCVEAIAGTRVEEFMQRPARFGEVARTFAGPALALAQPAQARTALTATAALEQAERLREKPLDDAARRRLIDLYLAGYQPWSAALLWSSLPAAARDGIDNAAADALDRLLASDNEIARIAIPLARRQGLTGLCHADTFEDEIDVAALAPALGPLMSDPAVARGLDRLNAEQARQWRAQDPDGLLALLAWMQGSAFETLDRSAQWDIFHQGSHGHGAGNRRLALWHARNAVISTYLFRAAAQPDGARVLFIVGASHRPFVERALRAQPWLRVTGAGDLLDP